MLSLLPLMTVLMKHFDDRLRDVRDNYQCDNVNVE
jgi:hypothetical protein